jgi:hypothetical protein
MARTVGAVGPEKGNEMDSKTLPEAPRACTAADVLAFLRRHPPLKAAPAALEPAIARFADELFELRRKYPHRQPAEILAARIAHFTEARLDQAPILQGEFVWRIRIGYAQRDSVLAARERIWRDADVRSLIVCGLDAGEIVAAINSAVAEALAPLLRGASSAIHPRVVMQKQECIFASAA